MFWLAAIPSALGAINLATYPRSLDGTEGPRSWRAVIDRPKRALKAAWSHHPLRRLLAEAATFQGTFKATKDYIQPVLASLAAVWLAHLHPEQGVALAAGAAYVVLHLFSALASRRAHRWVERFGSPRRANRVLWATAALLWVGLIPLLWWDVHWAAALAFILIAMLQNLFRPILVSRIDAVSDSRDGATVLSLESQSSSVVAMVLAPLLGLAIDVVLRLVP